MSRKVNARSRARAAFAIAAISGCLAAVSSHAAEHGEAIFAGGCFWCMETAFEGQPGVKSVVSGFAGGGERDVTYEQVSSGTTGHAESVRVLYDPAKTSYAKLLELYWHNIDPLSAEGQFCDRGHQYRSAIFYVDEAQKKAAEESKRAVAAQLKQKVVTEIVPATAFWPAEEYHQDFYKKNPGRYYSYRAGCGRDARLREIWGAQAGHSAVH
jgi:peptide-methionine (S)-S-oxide reductase